MLLVPSNSLYSQPGGDQEIIFNLGGELKSGYTLCYSIDSNYSEPQIKVSDKSKKITIYHNRYETRNKLILYKKDELMVIHFGDLELKNRYKLDLGTIEFQKGDFFLNYVDYPFEPLMDWGNYKLEALDSLHYIQIKKIKETDILYSAIIYDKKLNLIKRILYYDNNKVSSEHFRNHDFNSPIELVRAYYMDLSYYFIPKTYYSIYERIEIDSTGIIKNRIIYELANNGGLIKSFIQKNQIGKHYTEVINTLPEGVYPGYSSMAKLYDQFICSPFIRKGPYSIQISNVGYFPQDSIDINKFKAYQDSVELKITFASGAEKIGKPIVKTQIIGDSIHNNIYLVVSQSEDELALERVVKIKLSIDASKINTIHFPATSDKVLLIPEGEEFRINYLGAWPIQTPIIIYGINSNNK